MPKKYISKKNVNDAFKVIPGIGTLSVAIPFTPDYIKVDFHGPFMSSKPKEDLQDEVYWNLTAVTPDTYQLDIAWSVYTTREIYYRISHLSVDPV